MGLGMALAVVSHCSQDENAASRGSVSGLPSPPLDRMRPRTWRLTSARAEGRACARCYVPLIAAERADSVAGPTTPSSVRPEDA